MSHTVVKIKTFFRVMGCNIAFSKWNCKTLISNENVDVDGNQEIGTVFAIVTSYLLVFKSLIFLHVLGIINI